MLTQSMCAATSGQAQSDCFNNPIGIAPAAASEDPRRPPRPVHSRQIRTDPGPDAGNPARAAAKLRDWQRIYFGGFCILERCIIRAWPIMGDGLSPGALVLLACMVRSTGRTPGSDPTTATRAPAHGWAVAMGCSPREANNRIKELERATIITPAEDVDADWHDRTRHMIHLDRARAMATQAYAGLSVAVTDADESEDLIPFPVLDRCARSPELVWTWWFCWTFGETPDRFERRAWPSRKRMARFGGLPDKDGPRAIRKRLARLEKIKLIDRMGDIIRGTTDKDYRSHALSVRVFPPTVVLTEAEEAHAMERVGSVLKARHAQAQKPNARTRRWRKLSTDLPDPHEQQALPPHEQEALPPMNSRPSDPHEQEALPGKKNLLKEKKKSKQFKDNSAASLGKTPAEAIPDHHHQPSILLPIDGGLNSLREETAALTVFAQQGVHVTTLPCPPNWSPSRWAEASTIFLRLRSYSSGSNHRWIREELGLDPMAFVKIYETTIMTPPPR